MFTIIKFINKCYIPEENRTKEGTLILYNNKLYLAYWLPDSTIERILKEFIFFKFVKDRKSIDYLIYASNFPIKSIRDCNRTFATHKITDSKLETFNFLVSME